MLLLRTRFTWLLATINFWRRAFQVGKAAQLPTGGAALAGTAVTVKTVTPNATARERIIGSSLFPFRAVKLRNVDCPSGHDCGKRGEVAFCAGRAPCARMPLGGPGGLRRRRLRGPSRG